MIDAATGVAGKIDPGSRVNIYATFKAENDKQKDQSKVIVANARVIDVGKLTALDPGQSTNDRRNSATQAVHHLRARHRRRPTRRVRRVVRRTRPPHPGRGQLRPRPSPPATRSAPSTRTSRRPRMRSTPTGLCPR